MRVLKRYCLTFAGFLVVMICVNFPLQAHPHIFIDYYVRVEFDKNGLAGFRMNWEFDELSAVTYLLDYDSDQNGSLSEQEKIILKKEAFDNLRNYEYMTLIKIDGRKFKVNYVKEFDAHVKDSKLIYEFFIPCHVKASNIAKNISLVVFDDEFFVGFNLLKSKNRRFRADQLISRLTTVANGIETPYMGEIPSVELWLEFQKK